MKKNRLVLITDGLLFLLACLLIAARCQINEALPQALRLSGPLPGPTLAMGEISAMLILSALIILAVAAWLIVHLAAGAFTWRKTFLVLPLLLFLLAASLGKNVSNRHTAEITAFTFLACLLLALLLVQLLDTPRRRRLLLSIVAATGVTFAYRCWEQHHYEIPETIRLFEENPNALLARQNLTPGTYQAQQYINRLKSRDIGGYFAISNTAASFLILSLAATIALAAVCCDRSVRPPFYLLILLVALAQLAALWLTQSKGGIFSALAAFALGFLLWYKRRFLRRHARAALIVTFILLALSLSTLIAYGLAYDRLPSNSLWVRWQYWHATADMIADRPLTGVGPGNFGDFYPRYMPAGAPEIVKDPHCLWLALWSQWGLFGLLGFSYLVIRLTCRLAFAPPPEPTLSPVPPNPPPNKHPARAIPTEPAPPSKNNPWRTTGTILWALALTIGLVITRRLTSDLTGLSPLERDSVHLISFFLPAFIWLVAFILLQLTLPTNGSGPAETTYTGLARLILTCGLLGFLLHNSIDFGIFQPGVCTCAFALLALLVAFSLKPSADAFTPRLAPLRRLPLILLPPLLLALLLWQFIVPVCLEQHCLKQAEYNALRAVQNESSDAFLNPRYRDRYLQNAEHLARRAAALYPANPHTHDFLGRLEILRWNLSGQKNNESLTRAAEFFRAASSYNSHTYKYYRRLAETCRARLEKNPADSASLEQALRAAQQALRCYPTNSELLIEYGRLLLEAQQPDRALAAFQKALDSEQAFLDQQRQMVPDELDRLEMLPRLSPDLHRWTEGQVQKMKQNQTEPKQ